MLIMAWVVPEILTSSRTLPAINLNYFHLCQHYFKKISEGLWRKKGLSSTPRLTQFIKMLEPLLWYFLYILTFYGPAADVD